MPTPDELEKQQQKLSRLELSLAKQRMKARREDTRRKIELGGLVIKAKMDTYNKAIILGALISASESIQQEKNVQQIYQTKGELAFLNKHKTK